MFERVTAYHKLRGEFLKVLADHWMSIGTPEGNLDLSVKLSDLYEQGIGTKVDKIMAKNILVRHFEKYKTIQSLRELLKHFPEEEESIRKGWVLKLLQFDITSWPLCREFNLVSYDEVMSIVLDVLKTTPPDSSNVIEFPRFLMTYFPFLIEVVLIAPKILLLLNLDMRRYNRLVQILQDRDEDAFDAGQVDQLNATSTDHLCLGFRFDALVHQPFASFAKRFGDLVTEEEKKNLGIIPDPVEVIGVQSPVKFEEFDPNKIFSIDTVKTDDVNTFQLDRFEFKEESTSGCSNIDFTLSESSEFKFDTSGSSQFTFSPANQLRFQIPETDSEAQAEAAPVFHFAQ
jgi:hypothetical protein